MRLLAFRYSNPFQNASETNYVMSANFADFASKIGFYGNVSWDCNMNE